MLLARSRAASLKLATAANAARVHERDLIFALRKDPRRKQRVEELLKVYDELIRTREGQDTARDLDDLENV